MASPKVVRSQPVSASIGSWKKPMAERGPKVSTAISEPAMMISHGKPGLATVSREVDGETADMALLRMLDRDDTRGPKTTEAN